MPRIRAMFEAAASLSGLLSQAGIAHAFHGGFLAVVLGSARDTEEIFCIVDKGFRRVREAVQDSDIITAAFSTWSNRLFLTYTEPIPPIEIEILNAGEGGPRSLNSSTVALIRQLPFLTVTEFLRAKLNAWASTALDTDVDDITYILTRFWTTIDINRVPEHEMERFVAQYPHSAAAWAALKGRYGG